MKKWVNVRRYTRDEPEPYLQRFIRRADNPQSDLTGLLLDTRGRKSDSIPAVTST